VQIHQQKLFMISAVPCFIMGVLHLVTRVGTTSFYLFWHLISNKDRTILVSPNGKHPLITSDSVLTQSDQNS